MRRLPKRLFETAVWPLALALAACAGSPAGSQATVLPPPPAVATTAPALPALTATNAPAPLTTASAAGQSATLAPPEAAPTEGQPLFDGLPHGYTAEGFPYLGEAGAPATLTDYSDFL